MLIAIPSNAPGGLEYYLPLFFEQTATLFDYLPDDVLCVVSDGTREAAEAFLRQVEERFEQRRHDAERPLLPPDRLYLDAQTLTTRLQAGQLVRMQRTKVERRRNGFARYCNFATQSAPALAFQALRTSDRSMSSAVTMRPVGDMLSASGSPVPGRRHADVATSTRKSAVKVFMDLSIVPSRLRLRVPSGQGCSILRRGAPTITRYPREREETSLAFW